jgi:hypothetical protein
LPTEQSLADATSVVLAQEVLEETASLVVNLAQSPSLIRRSSTSDV